MAIRLTDIVTVMKNKWTYGDKFFGYTDEFNDNHNTQYPSILITPPSSVFPEVSLNNGWELYSFEIYFSDLYNRTAQANVNLDQRWDNLQDLSNEWLDMFLKEYQDGIVTGYLEGEDVSVERVKEVANDQLIQIRMNFTWKVFSKCFRPQSTYPSDLAGLNSWFRADSGLTFSIPTKRVSAWEDQSGNANSAAQALKEKQALRYTYDGANDKTRIAFNGTTDFYTSNSNSTIGTEFTMFFVAQVDISATETSRYFYYSNGQSLLSVGSDDNQLTASFSDASGNSGTVTLSASYKTSNYHIAMVKLENKRLYLEYNNAATDSVQVANYDNTHTFSAAPFKIGSTGQAASAPPVPADYYNYLKGSMQEVIIYNSSLADYSVGQIKGYLNKKYNIY
jgi:hypothetical protein